MPPLEVGKKYLVEPKDIRMISNPGRIMNNADIKKPPIAKYLGGKAFLFDSDTAALGVHTEIPDKAYWKFTPEDGGDPVEVHDTNDPQPVSGGRRKTRKHTRRVRKTRRRHR
jgi:hypothetical protein